MYDEQEEEPGRIPLFVYGTLQPHEALFSLVEDDLIDTPKAAVVFGYKLYQNKTNSYPYLVEAGDTDYAFGTLLTIPYGQAWDRVARMEVGAGYLVEMLSVYINRADHEAGLVEVRSVGFILPKQNHWMLGEEVADHLWQDYAAVIEDDVELVQKTLG